MPVELPPVDPNVELPPSVRRAAAKAAKVHAAAYAPQPEPQPSIEPVQPVQPVQPAPATVVAVDPQPVPDPVPAVDPQPVPVAPPVITEGEWENRYKAMKGRFDQSTATVTQLQQQIQMLGGELSQATAAISQLRAGQPRPNEAPVTPLLTEEDRKTYGPELIDVVQRAAREALMPDLQKTQREVNQVNQRVTQSAQGTVYEQLAERVPNWRQINVSQEFKTWCALPDVYSGQVRGTLLNAALRAASAPRVLAFFEGFIRDEVAAGRMQAPQPEPQNLPAPRQAAVPLASLAAPGRAHPAAGNTTPVAGDKPIFTRGQISRFYSQEGRKAYEGREKDRQADEAMIFEAQREGRVRG
jgi:hypothetical protein